MTINKIKHEIVLNHRIRWIFLFLLMMIISGTSQMNKEPAFVMDFFNVNSLTSDKVVQLAEAIPADKYNWRPAEGVRSVKEVIMHIAGANYYFASLLGTTTPQGINPRNLEKSQASKEKIISTLKNAVVHLHKAIKNIKDNELNQEVEFFGNKGTKRQVVMLTLNHVAEHLGQLIAYARMNNIVPPWSQSGN